MASLANSLGSKVDHADARRGGKQDKYMVNGNNMTACVVKNISFACTKQILSVVRALPVRIL